MLLSKNLQQPDSQPKLSYFWILAIFFLYSISFTIVVPVFPKLLEVLCSGNAREVSRQYGFITSLKYGLEFVSAPTLGAVSDLPSVGRRRILALSLSSICFELLIISLYPSLLFIYLATFFRGLLDHTQTMIYTVAADIAAANGEPVTKPFGYLGGVFGLGCIVGPMCGSLLAAQSVPLCFQVAALIGLAALGTALLTIGETLPPSPPSPTSLLDSPYILPPQIVNTSYGAAYPSPPQSPLSPQSSLALLPPAKDTSSLLLRINPLTNLRLFFSHPVLRRLSLPFLLSHFCTGVYFIWILYMDSEFSADVIAVGTFLSIAGCVQGVMQGVIVPALVPAVLSDEGAVRLGLCVSALQMACYGLAPNLGWFYLVMGALSCASVYGPTLKSLFVKAAAASSETVSLPTGALQGALSSLRTLTAGLGALAFTALYSSSLENPGAHGAPFFLASACYSVAAVYAARVLWPHQELEVGLDLLPGWSALGKAYSLRTSSDDGNPAPPSSLSEGASLLPRSSSGSGFGSRQRYSSGSLALSPRREAP